MAKAVSEYIKVASRGEIPEGKMRNVLVGGQQVLLTNVKGNFHAIGNVCTHMGGPLDKGKLEDGIVQCPWHGSHFDVTTGQVKRGPASRPEPVYEVKVEGDNILVRPRQ